MADHRSSELRHMPDWAVVPFWVGVLCLIAAWAFAGVAVGVHFAT